VLLAAVERGLAGTWCGGRNETYCFHPVDEGRWRCVRKDEDGSTKTFTTWMDADSDAVWWGSNGTYLFRASEVASKPDHIGLYAAVDRRARRPRFVWYRQTCPAPEQQSSQACSSLAGTSSASSGTATKASACRWVSRAGASDSTQQLSDAAIAEIEAQLWEAPPSGGYVWVSGWNERYFWHLGPVRTFLESHPEHFVVHSGRSNGYRVSLATGAPSAGAPHAQPGTSAAAQQKAARAQGGRWRLRQVEA